MYDITEKLQLLSSVVEKISKRFMPSGISLFDVSDISKIINDIDEHFCNGYSEDMRRRIEAQIVDDLAILNGIYNYTGFTEKAIMNFSIFSELDKLATNLLHYTSQTFTKQATATEHAELLNYLIANVVLSETIEYKLIILALGLLVAELEIPLCIVSNNIIRQIAYIQEGSVKNDIIQVIDKLY